MCQVPDCARLGTRDLDFIRIRGGERVLLLVCEPHYEESQGEAGHLDRFLTKYFPQYAG
jgi:hypothetical protein